MQWILNEVPGIREIKIRNLVRELEDLLVDTGSVVIQFYPRTSRVLEEVKDGLGEEGTLQGSSVIDNPDNPRKRKIYLTGVKSCIDYCPNRVCCE